MKRLLIIGFISFFVSVSAFSQKNASPEQKAQKKVEKLNQELTLTNEQKDKLTAVFVKGEDKKTQNAEIKAILTSEQFEKYQAVQAEKKANSKKREKGSDTEKKGGKKK